jgi:hypothetical protein
MGGLDIKDEALIAEAKELAALLGTSATGAVRERRAREVERKTAEMLEFAHEFASDLRGPPLTRAEMGDMPYDPKTGLPR